MPCDISFEENVCLPDLPSRPILSLDANSQITLEIRESVAPSEINSRTGILTGCPSASPFSYALGPPNPGLIISAQETLGLRWTGFSPVFLLLIPAFSLLSTPPSLTTRLRRAKNAPLPICTMKYKVLIFGNRLSPDKFSARKNLTSELLRFL